MTIKIEVKPLQGGVEIRAMEGEERVGFYRLTEESEGRFLGHMESRFPRQGIPRILIQSATEQLQALASQRGKTITHLERFISPESQLKLPRLFREQGYVLISQDDTMIPLTKEYHPQPKHPKETLKKSSQPSHQSGSYCPQDQQHTL